MIIDDIFYFNNHAQESHSSSPTDHGPHPPPLSLPQETERSFRSQIQALEKRAHESWVTCRQAERRLEEDNREAQQYRAL